MSHITIQLRNGSLLHRIRKDDSSKCHFLKISSQLMRHPLIEFFHLSNLLQMLNDSRVVNAVECFSTTLTTSWVVVRGSVSMMALNWSLSPSDGWPLHSSRLLSPLQNCLNHHCTVCSLAILSQMRCWCFKLSSLLYDPFWTQIRKSLKFAFCLTSFP